jgi:hypothetical protein
VIGAILFIAAFVVLAIVLCWALRAFAAAFAPTPPTRAVNQIVVVLQVVIVVVILLYVMAHFGLIPA